MIILNVANWIVNLLLIAISILCYSVALFIMSLLLFMFKEWLNKRSEK